MVYTYDGAGNRLTAVKTSGDKPLCNIQYTYNDNNQVTDIEGNCDDDNKQTHIVLTYDENGNLKNTTCNDTEKVREYTYDNENRLKAVHENGTLLMAALYDGNGDRIFRLDYRKNSDYVSNKAGTAENVYYPTSSVNSAYDTDVILNEMLIPNGVTQNTAINYELTGYINDVNTEYTQTLMEFGANGNTTNIYEYGDGRNSATINGSKGYYLYDGRGSVAGLAGNSGGSMITYSYDAYGNTTKSNNALNNPYQYNAEYTDSSTGLQYLRARYYESSQGRFTTKDTVLGSIEKPITRNLYAYCGNNPLNYTDPSGHNWFTSAVNSVKKTAKKAVNAVTSAANKYVVKPVKNAAKTVKNAVNKYVVQPVKSFIKDPKGTAEKVCKTIKTKAQNLRTKATQSWNNFITDAGNKIQNAYNKYVPPKMQKAIEEAKKFVCTTKDRIVKDVKDFVSNVDWDRVAQGAMLVVTATVVVTVGVVAIVSTAGAAAPAIAALAAGTATTLDVITVGTLAAGVTATAFGAADAFEAGQDLAAGFDGDSDYVSFNPIRDTVFADAPELYYLTEAVTTYGAGAGTEMVNSMKVQDTPSNGQTTTNSTSQSNNHSDYSNSVTGSKNNQLNQPKNPSYQSGRNTTTTINDRDYSGHALDRMQDRGIMPSVVENTIQNGTASNSYNNTIKYYDATNNVSVVTNETGKVVTVTYGKSNG